MCLRVSIGQVGTPAVTHFLFDRIIESGFEPRTGNRFLAIQLESNTGMRVGASDYDLLSLPSWLWDMDSAQGWWSGEGESGVLDRSRQDLFPPGYPT